MDKMVVKILCFHFCRGLTANQGHDWNGDWPNLRLPVHRLPPWQVQRHPGFPWTLLYRLHPRLLQPTHRFQLQLLLRRLPRYLLGRDEDIPVRDSLVVFGERELQAPRELLAPRLVEIRDALSDHGENLHAEAHPLGHSSSRRRVALHLQLQLHLLLLLQRQEACTWSHPVSERRCPRRTQACSPSISLGSSFAYFTSSEIKLRRGSRRGRRHREQTRLHPS